MSTVGNNNLDYQEGINKYSIRMPWRRKQATATLTYLLLVPIGIQIIFPISITEPSQLSLIGVPKVKDKDKVDDSRWMSH
jgi:hypothetical protein